MKPRVLLLHGLTGVPNELQTVARDVRAAGYEVETPMLAGHGINISTLNQTGWREWLDGAQRDLTRMAVDGPIFVGGHSVGAVIALALAEVRPDLVRGLALLAPTVRYDGWAVPKSVFIFNWANRVPFLRPLAKYYNFKERHPFGLKDARLRERVVGWMRAGKVEQAGLSFTPGIGLSQTLLLAARTIPHLAEISVPTLIVHPLEDDVTHVRNAEAIAQRLGGAVRTLFLTDSYHLVTIDRQRRIVGKALATFFDDVREGYAFEKRERQTI